MRKNLGIFLLLAAIMIFTAALSDNFLLAANLENLIRRTSLFGILSIGAAIVIIAGGIDLAIGSMVCLIGTLLPFLLVQGEWPAAAAVCALAAASILLGYLHGALVTALRMQPFIVTLCGLLLYRGAARGITADQTVGFGTGFQELRLLATGKVSIPFIDGFHLPAPFFFFLLLAVLAAIFLNRTTYGRYLIAVGANEEATRLCGINTGRVTILAYVLCALLSGIGGMLFVLDVNSAQPADFGNFYELYAIAAAVLGGCSLRGGQGSILGVVIGTAVLQVLRNATTLLGIPTQLEFAIIGGVILIGVAADELVKIVKTRRTGWWK